MMVLLKKLHKWVGLLIGIQVMLWLLSGLMISLLDPVKVSGKQWATPAASEQQTLNPGVLLEPDELPPEQLRGALTIKLAVNRDLPVYRIQRSESETLLNAVDGSVMTTSKTDADKIARTDYIGSGEIISIKPGMAPDMETRNHAGEYWKVDFSDDVDTSLYISVATGEFLERRNSYWRVRDFFWMLHIMDYSGRENFNNALVITIVLIAVWLGISGFILIFGSFGRADFYFLNILRKSRMAGITLLDPVSGSLQTVSLRKGSNLFLSLATHGIDLPSICGGGGECGKCRLKIESENLPAPSSTEQGLIPRSLREKGYRLACQQEVTDGMKLHMPKGSLI